MITFLFNAEEDDEMTLVGVTKVTLLKSTAGTLYIAGQHRLYIINMILHRPYCQILWVTLQSHKVQMF